MAHNILAIETSLHRASVAVFENDTLLACRDIEEKSKQAERLLIETEAVLQEANLSYAEITHGIVSAGPGQFTSIRIGMAAMRGIALATPMQLMSVTSLSTIAQQSEHEIVMAVLNAGRGDIYWQCFQKDAHDLIPLSEATVSKIEPCIEAAERYKAQPCGQKIDEVNVHDEILPHASAMGSLAWQLISGDRRLYIPNTPLYLKKPDAKTMEERGKLQPGTKQLGCTSS